QINFQLGQLACQYFILFLRRSYEISCVLDIVSTKYKWINSIDSPQLGDHMQERDPEFGKNFLHLRIQV
ncbi:MAG: hypothetical protein JWN30_2722, partial [Bacilli bacterium]|nr:hypothetical protein [Bacilli bacterium]